MITKLANFIKLITCERENHLQQSIAPIFTVYRSFAIYEQRSTHFLVPSHDFNLCLLTQVKWFDENAKWADLTTGFHFYLKPLSDLAKISSKNEFRSFVKTVRFYLRVAMEILIFVQEDVWHRRLWNIFWSSKRSSLVDWKNVVLKLISVIKDQK